LCNELGLQPSVFYQWQRQVLDNLASAPPRRRVRVAVGDGIDADGRGSGYG
jgi:transposase-like protein